MLKQGRLYTRLWSVKPNDDTANAAFFDDNAREIALYARITRYDMRQDRAFGTERIYGLRPSPDHVPGMFYACRESLQIAS
jgi:hypothetical protein